MPGAGRTEPIPGRGICAGPVGLAGIAGRVAATPAFGSEGLAGLGRCIAPTFGRWKFGACTFGRCMLGVCGLACGIWGRAIGMLGLACGMGRACGIWGLACGMGLAMAGA